MANDTEYKNYLFINSNINVDVLRLDRDTTISLDGMNKDGKDIYVNVTVDDDFYIAKTDFNKSIFDNNIKQAKETLQSKFKRENVVINSYF